MLFLLKTYGPNRIILRMWFVLLIVVLTVFKIPGQSVTAPSVSVGGEVLMPQKFSIDELKRLKQSEITAKDHEGKDRLFKGVALVELLGVAGVTLGGQLRGKNLMKYVIVSAADNYRVVFSLAEIDPEFTSQIILLAYEIDGKPLEKGDEPFRMVVPNDKKHARWIREVTSIEVVSSAK